LIQINGHDDTAVTLPVQDDLQPREAYMRGLEHRTALVTGGGGGIGGAICHRLAAAGTRVAVLDRDADAAARTAAELGDDARSFAVDIADHDAVSAAVVDVESAMGPVDVMVNNAGWDVFRPFLDTQPELWRRLIDVNLVGALNMHHAVLPGMVERGRGRVVNIASDAARVGSSGEAVYSACKAGLVGLSKTLAREHARHGITFNVVCPGPTETPLLDAVVGTASSPDKLREAFRRAVPMGRLGQPEDLAGVVAFLASDEASYITGQVVSVSGGLTMSG
jgi:2-hydroxycyclohexanecarboxyl-CoA dehydrogenase